MAGRRNAPQSNLARITINEDQTTEWKETWKDDFLKVLCGFANAEGGTLVIGRDDAGNPVGVRNAAKLLEDLPNKLRIWNPGHLPEGWTVAKLLGAHSSKPFNPEIAGTFFRAGEIEAWGRGIQRIFSACKEAANPTSSPIATRAAALDELAAEGQRLKLE